MAKPVVLPSVSVLAAACALALLLLGSPPADAARFVVDSTLDDVDADVGDGRCATASGACTLRAAVNEANDASGVDTIVLPAGTYGLTIAPGPVAATSFFGDLDVVHDLKIRGAGAGTTVIDAGGIDRAFQVRWLGGGHPTRLELRGVSIVGGNPPEGHGGAIYGFNGSIRLVDAVVADNEAGLGGGVDLLGGELRLVRSRIERNVGSSCCGGIRALLGARVRMDRSVVQENHATGAGASAGGIMCFSDTELDLSRSSVRDNSAAGGSGGIRFIGKRGRIKRSTIEGNRAASGAGGISLKQPDPALPVPGALLITDSSIVGNDADADGDGLGSGGGLYVDFPTWASPNSPELKRTIVSGNSDGDGSTPDCSGILVDRGGNTLGDPAGCMLLPPG